MIKHIHPNNLKYLSNVNVKYIKCLGRGGCGVVELYKCIPQKCIPGEKGPNKEIVIKRIKGEWNKQRNKYFLNEYTIGIILHHPYIRETLDIDIIDHCIIFEYCNGVNFFSFLTKTNHVLTDEYLYFSQLLDAIEYMHNLGIAHLDLKLENIMIDTQNKTIKIIDFGESRVFNTGNNKIIKEKGQRGTKQYMSPEEFTNLEYNPEKVDVWMCGIILYEILYKSIPWEEASNKCERYILFNKYFNNNNNLYPQIFCIEENNTEFLKILKKMLTPIPEERCSISLINKEFKSIQVSS
jgi:serine/threonine protein kinase